MSRLAYTINGPTNKMRIQIYLILKSKWLFSLAWIAGIIIKK